MLQDPQLFCFMANMKNFAHSKCFNLPFLSVLGDRLPPFGVHYFIWQSLKNQFQSEPSAEKSPQVKSIDIFHPPVDLTNPTRGLFPFHLCCIRSEWNATQLSHLSRKICTLGIFPICKLCTTFKSDPRPSLFIPSNAMIMCPLCIIINSVKYDTSVGPSS